jgi:hypothetical protein
MGRSFYFLTMTTMTMMTTPSLYVSRDAEERATCNNGQRQQNDEGTETEKRVKQNSKSPDPKF